MDTKINLRVDEYTKDTLEAYAQENGKSLSEYVREILDDHVGLEYDHDDIEENASRPIQYVTLDITVDFEKTFQFTQLTAWLFFKYIYPKDSTQISNIKILKGYVERTIDESSFSRELKIEFLKVLADINRFLVEPEYDGKQFYFSIYNHQSYFDYNMLINEIWSVK